MASKRVSALFRLACDNPVYVWSGFGDLDTPADDLDASGARWRGAGDLVSIPTLKHLINGEADRIDVIVSGVSAPMLRLALEDKESVRGAQANIGLIEFDDDWQVAGPIKWQWTGKGGVIATESADNDGQRAWSLSLSMASADTLLANPSLSYFTSSQQRRRSSDDLFCDQVASINQGTTRRFGPS
ncbi:hypothetical protein [Novosphingobium sp. MBES04]|uniref:hypothetical protein n=1 Tax=Novosphingobium sp. MBES04 TaxID=1206458 RepID=UPI00057F8DB9|nr:hypothetical protein [Novosphingobium sp. MBES04]GAM06322.1 hypothetical conserved protein [Novosphingobium sp. MBES04]